MKTFEADSKINFVDDNNVFVGFSYDSCCCEQFGHYFHRTLGVTPDMAAPVEDFDTEGYQFDKTFCEETESGGDSGGKATFRLTRPTTPTRSKKAAKRKGPVTCEVLYLTIYNHHNGYYSHGFEMKVGDKTVKTGSL